MTIPFIDLEAQYQAYKESIDLRIAEVLRRHDFIMGQDVRELELWMSNYTDTHALAVSSGTDALMIALYAMDLNPGDEIITTPFTFFATAEVIAFLGLRPVFVDIDKDTCNIDVTKIEAAITAKTKGIISVSLFGQTSDLDAIEAIARKHKIFHIEDGAQSFGAIYRGKKSCSVTDMSITSFFPSKPLGTYGDGGMIFLKDKDFALKCQSILNQGQIKRYDHKYVGVNARFDTIKAAILMAKLPHYESELEKREYIASRYHIGFKGYPIQILKRKKFTNRHVWAQYTIRIEDRDTVQLALEKKGIPTTVHYPKALHLQEAFAYLGLSEGTFPIAENMMQSVLSIPICPFLSESTQDYIIESLVALLV